MNNQRGAVLIWVTLMIVLLLIMVGVGLDTGQITYTRSQAQSAVDAAALAAVSGLPSRDASQIAARATSFNTNNDYVGSSSNGITSSDVSYVHYDFTTNTIDRYNEPIATANGVRVARETSHAVATPVFLTPLMNLLGLATSDTENVNVSAVATIATRPAIPIALWQTTCAAGNPVQNGVQIMMQHPDQNNAGEDSCWTTFFDCSSGAPDIKGGFTTASTCSGNPIDGDVELGSLICQNKGQVNTVMQVAQDFFLNTPSNVGKWWIIPVIGGTGNCAPTNPTKIVDFAKIQVTDVVKNGSPKYLTANIQCGQSLYALDESLCFTHRLVREPTKGY